MKIITIFLLSISAASSVVVGSGNIFYGIASLMFCLLVGCSMWFIEQAIKNK